MTKYYSFNGTNIAMRSGTGSPVYLYGDGLNSTLYTTNANAIANATRGYLAFGGKRYSEGAMPTDRRFTGQQEDATGIYYFNARCAVCNA